jgi:MFS family permease
MLNAQRNLSTGFLVLLSLPTAAVGFALSSGIATTTWLLSTRYGLHLENIALIWLMGPLMGLLVQPLVGALSDRTWLMNGRRRPFLVVGGVVGAASTFAMLKLDTIATVTGTSLLAVAVFVALVADLATNVTFNPARSLVADLTPEGPARVRGYAWMQTVSGVLGISAYLISIFLGNHALVLITVAVVFFLTVLPLFFIAESAPSPAALAALPGTPSEPKRTQPFQSLLPMSGFMAYGVFIAADKLLFDDALAVWAVPLFVATVALTLVWGGYTVWQGRRHPSRQTRLRTMLLAHGFAWLGLQSMFVMSFFYVRDFVVPTAAGSVLADGLYRLANATGTTTAADTAGRILSMGFLLLNLVGAALPVLVLKPLCQRLGKVAVHRGAMGSMAVAYVFLALAPASELFYYLGMLLCGMGWSSLISIVFAIYSESVDSREMGVSMGVFNSSLVLPALAVPGLLKLSDALHQHRWVFLLFALCLAVSFAFWCAVSERADSGAEHLAAA